MADLDWLEIPANSRGMTLEHVIRDAKAARRFWLDRGRDFRCRLVLIEEGVWGIKSNMRNGFPPAFKRAAA